jgi:ABC-type transporter Mla subunit MlaD
MSENRVEVLTGAVVLAVAAGFLVWAGQGRGLGSSMGSYPLHASFRSVEGVQVGTDVRMAGVKIGSVTDTQGAVSLLTLLMKFVGGSAKSGSGEDAPEGAAQ